MSKLSVPFTRPTLPALSELSSDLRRIFRSGIVTNGYYVNEFERQCAKVLGVREAVAVSSGTGALQLLLLCLGLKGEIILPSFTFSSGGHAALLSGLTPVFADINPKTFNLDPSDVEAKITKKTVAILPTHVFGNPCEVRAFERLGKKYKIQILFDAAHAFGSQVHGYPISKYGTASIFSFTPTKIITTTEGGLIATNNTRLAYQLRLGRNNGDSFDRSEEFLGLSARMNEVSALIGLWGVKHFSSIVSARLLRVRLYKKLLRSIPGIELQQVSDDNTVSVYKDMAVMVDDGRFGKSRDSLLKHLQRNGIQARVYFDPPLHEKLVYQRFARTGLAHTEWVSRHIMSLPLSSTMRVSDIKKICAVIKAYHEAR